ncbi:hypothetical protein [Acidithiobacillus sulfurivorans]|jgi:hypothetical protein|uniref:S-adenosylhomocysteine hydrolase n=1 Tax=Acidithiobacillus sulfurivorans TaxID=1958756 RepID=A0ABS6A2G9_9PROT|nr:hypothetical protein [Acidithiobacillus sulfurivorans]MBU2761711.1 S-adenosylhomocysteine hydrolase [Acidithiobacillus sulfurivorans]
MKASKVKQRILDYLSARPDENAFIRSEFNALSQSRSGVDKAIRVLVSEGVLVRGGYGVLVRGEFIPEIQSAAPLVWPEIFAKEALVKLGIDPKPNSAVVEYNSGRTTQVPAWLAFDVGNSRIVRKIGFGKRLVNYERERKVE